VDVVHLWARNEAREGLVKALRKGYAEVAKWLATSGYAEGGPPDLLPRIIRSAPIARCRGDRECIPRSGPCSARAWLTLLESAKCDTLRFRRSATGVALQSCRAANHEVRCAVLGAAS
jgi:hypothetical protein